MTYRNIINAIRIVVYNTLKTENKICRLFVDKKINCMERKIQLSVFINNLKTMPSTNQ